MSEGASTQLFSDLTMAQPLITKVADNKIEIGRTTDMLKVLSNEN
jgi:hypothetical protein